MAVFGIICRRVNNMSRCWSFDFFSFSFRFTPFVGIFLGLAQDIIARCSRRIESLGRAAHSLNAKKRKRNPALGKFCLGVGGIQRGNQWIPLVFIVNYFGSLQNIFNSSCTIVQDICNSKYIIVFLVFIDMLMIPLIKQCLSLIVISMVFIDSSKLSLVYQCILSPSRGKGTPLIEQDSTLNTVSLADWSFSDYHWWQCFPW